VTNDSTLELDSDPLWYKDAIVYELHARAFFDSDDDGMGDFRGLTRKLDYLQDLGVTTLWLLPFFPSPWRDDGYDISDYKEVHPAYGTLRDFQSFLKQAHRRGIRVLTEVVLNHTSDQHPWFQHSRNAAPGGRWRDFYVWSNTPEKYQDARIIFKDFETSNWSWDPVAKAYYWHRFYTHQPDLNFDNPQVRRAVMDVIDFWCEMGVDGFRLDAVPYLFEREGTVCENLPETHDFLRSLRSFIDSKYQERVLLAEANQWPEDAVAYFGKGDECHMAFHFPVMTRLFMAIRMEDRFPILEILQETPTIPPSSQWAMFLRNHDELTLEMVTDEERDYMYRVYGRDRRMRINLGIRRRLAPLLENNRRKIELMNAVLFSLPGTPVIYYGDEIGMGDNIYLGDRNGVRTPMQWSSDRNAGFSRANPQKLYLPVIIDPEYHYEAVNVEAQQNNPHSLLWWMKNLIEQRKRYKAFGRGTLEFLRPSNRKILAFYRRYQDETILVVANLSRFPQHAELDLSGVKGMTPVEVFGRSEFPVVTDQVYNLTLGSLSFYWFSLELRQARTESVAPTSAMPFSPLTVQAWDEVFEGKSLETMLARMPAFLRTRRWFQGKGRTIRAIDIKDQIAIPDTHAQMLLAEVDYNDGDPETYLMPGSVATGDAVQQVKQRALDAAVGEIQTPDGAKGVLYSAIWDPAFRDALLGAIARRRRLRGRIGELAASHNRAFRKVWGSSHPELGSSVLNIDQANSAFIYGNRFFLKLYRRLESGIHPEVEIGGFLTEKEFGFAPPLTGTIEYRLGDDTEGSTVAVLFGYVENQGDAWRYTLDTLSQFFEVGLARKDSERAGFEVGRHPLELRNMEPPPQVHELIGAYFQAAQLMGQRTADLHLALSSDIANPSFAPESFTDYYRHALQHSMLALTNNTLQTLRARLNALPENLQTDAQQVLGMHDRLRARFRLVSERRAPAVRIRIHDDLLLRRLLHTGKDFVFVGFEGRSQRPLSERRIKRSPLRDLASMLLSFQCAADAVFQDQLPNIRRGPEILPALESLSAYWVEWISAAYVKGYVGAIGQSSRLWQPDEDIRFLLDTFLLEHALEELQIQLRRDNPWVRSPLKTLLRTLGLSAHSHPS